MANLLSAIQAFGRIPGAAHFPSIPRLDYIQEPRKNVLHFLKLAASKSFTSSSTQVSVTWKDARSGGS